MEYIVRSEKRTEVLPCECGTYPTFEHPYDGYTDTWLRCPNCGKRTYNTGGFHYASEIPLERAEMDAITAWNNGDFMKRMTSGMCKCIKDWSYYPFNKGVRSTIPEKSFHIGDVYKFEYQSDKALYCLYRDNEKELCNWAFFNNMFEIII